MTWLDHSHTIVVFTTETFKERNQCIIHLSIDDPTRFKLFREMGLFPLPAVNFLLLVYHKEGSEILINPSQTTTDCHKEKLWSYYCYRRAHTHLHTNKNRVSLEKNLGIITRWESLNRNKNRNLLRVSTIAKALESPFLSEKFLILEA